MGKSINQVRGDSIWSLKKQQDLYEKLPQAWREDTWLLTELLRLENNDSSNYKGRPISFLSELATTIEVKYAFYKILATTKCSIPAIKNKAHLIRSILKWQKVSMVNEKSMIIKGYNYWTKSLNSFLDNNPSEYTLNKRVFFKQIYNEVIDYYDDRPEIVKDIWDARKLGMEVSKINPIYTLNFSKISQSWLKNAFKSFVYHNIHSYTFATTNNHLYWMNKFSGFLNENYPRLKSTQLSRNIVLEYLYEMRKKYIEGTLHKAVYNLKTFFDHCSYFKLLEVMNSPLIYKEDMLPKPKSNPRFISEHILNQLNAHLSKLPVDIMRMLQILQECGMRFSELILLPFDCLISDNEGDSFLKYYQYKTKKEHLIPLTKELATVIYNHQNDVLERWGNQPEYLFINESGNNYKSLNIYTAINKLAEENNIRKESGELYRFKAHEFRHTVGTRMINSGVPQHFVQRFLGHQNPMMTSIYAHIHNSTLKEEVLSKQIALINRNGIFLSEEDSEVYLQPEHSLPNGYCGLSVHISCPHANACLSCTHFRTDKSFLPIHIQHLDETKQLMDEAKANGWDRQLQITQETYQNLNDIVKALTKKED